MDSQLQTMIDNMPEKTGKSLDEWVVILNEKGLEKHGEAVKFLKSEHGVTHGFANTIVTLAKRQTDNHADHDLVDNQYKGKEALLPIYHKLIEVVKGFGKDVEIAPKKSTVSVRRALQFALIKPATKTRIDLGLKLRSLEPEGRLEPSGPFGTMCSHRVQLTSAEQVDQDVMDWLRQAYEEAG